MSGVEQGPEWAEVSAFADLTADLERARSLAVRLEQELAEVERQCGNAIALVAEYSGVASRKVEVTDADQIGTKLADLSEWIDGSYPESMIGTELHVRRRTGKLMEEAGEVGEAVGGWFGENPRKGITHTRADVLAELLDVATTALGAYESLTGNTGASIPALDTKLDSILERAALSAALGGGE